MLTITPGYNFDVHEVPTHAKLGLMVSGMSITDIDVSQIDSGLIGIHDASSAVSLTLEGHMRRDELNSVWVQTRNGEVKLFRSNWGGWETKRLVANAGNAPYNAAVRPMAATYNWFRAVAGDTSPTGIFATSAQNPASVDGFRHPGLDTCVSGGFARTLGRGACYQHATPNGVNVAFGFPALVDNTANNTDVSIKMQLDATGGLAVNYSGMVVRGFIQDTNRTNVVCWFYGASLSNQ